MEQISTTTQSSSNFVTAIMKGCVMKRRKAFGEMDSLPDEVILLVLSFLTIAEAAKTSVLSRRWKNLWRSASCDLAFDFAASGDDDASFVKSTTDVLKSLRCSNVDKLRFRLRIRSPNVTDDLICDWVRFAVQRQVRVLELDACGDIPPSVSTIHYSTEIRALRAAGNFHYPDLPSFGYNFPALEKLSVLSPPNKSCFASLTALKLVNFNIDEEMMDYVLTHCPFLEDLSLKGGTGLKNLNIISPPSLKYLSLGSCWDLQKLKVTAAARLVHFEYKGFPANQYVKQPDFTLEYVPFLSEVSMDTNFFLSFLDKKTVHEAYSNQLEKVVMHITCQEMISPFGYYDDDYNILPSMRCLKQLDMCISTIRGASLIFFVLCVKACPFLSTLSVEFVAEKIFDKYQDETAIENSLYHKRSLQKRVKRFRHRHLNVVTLIDLSGEKDELEFAVDLVQMCKALKQLTIKSKRSCDGSSQRMGVSKGEIEKLLEGNIADGAEVVIE